MERDRLRCSELTGCFSSIDISSSGTSSNFGSFCFFLSFLAVFVPLSALERGGVQRALADCKKYDHSIVL